MGPSTNRPLWRAAMAACPMIVGLSLWTANGRSTRFEPAESHAAEVKAAEVKAAEVKASGAKAAEVKAAEVKAAGAKLAMAGTRFPLDVRIVDPASGAKDPPAIIVFEKGLDTQGKDVTKALTRLKSLRGDSKMFPLLNADPGLPVVLRGLRFHRTEAAGGGGVVYEVDLLGEFNRVRVPVSVADMEKFLGGERVELKLKGSANYGIYSYESSIAMELRFEAGVLTVFRVTGDFRFRELLTTYISATRKIEAPAGRPHLYTGEIAELPELPGI